MIRTGGGCCDCGDLQGIPLIFTKQTLNLNFKKKAWKKSGCCVDHQGPPTHPEESLPTEMREKARKALVMILQVVLALSAKCVEDNPQDVKDVSSKSLLCILTAR